MATIPSLPRLSRRTVLRSSVVVAGATAFASISGPSHATPGIFAHGVASGDPLPHGVILWTRVTPSPEAAPGSGRGPDTVVTWEVSATSTFEHVVAAGSVVARVGTDHTVKVDVDGLIPGSTYFYRFRAVDAVSPTGRTSTAPADDASVERLRLGVVSCSHWEDGYFSAYRHLAARDDLDAVVHLGDYLYEYGVDGDAVAGESAVRTHLPANEIVTLSDYRVRHAQYKTDPDLQALHARVPWIVVWDDHESANDAWAGGAENHDPDTEGDWVTRRAAATRAYDEWMPVRTNSGRLYRRLRFGTLAELSMLDLRTYHSEQGPFGGREADDPARTITGHAQMEWLTAGLSTSPTRWQLVGNPVMFAPVLLPPLDPRTTGALTAAMGIPGTGVPFNTDQWDGYTADRTRLLEAIVTSGRRNVVFLTGDIHTSWAMDVPSDAADYPGAGTIATEFVVPSVTSANIDELLDVPPRSVSPGVEAALTATNGHVRFVELDSHGYGVLEVTPGAAQMDWFFIDDRRDPNSAAYRAAGYRVADGTSRVEPAPPL